MSAEHETNRIVRSWLEQGITALPERVLDSVLDQLPATPQRRPLWPARRFPTMNRPIRYAIAAAAVVVVALIGSRFLPRDTPRVGGPSPTPQITPLVTPAPSVRPKPSPKTLIVPPSGPLEIGRHELNLEGIPMSFEVTTDDWISNGIFGWDKGLVTTPAGAGFIVWEDDADGIFSDPCAQEMAPPVGLTAMDIAEAIASVPLVEIVTAPRDITIDGRHGVEVAIRIPDELPCTPNEYYLWYDTTIAGNARYATDYGMTIRVWILEENGHRLQLDAETYAGSKRALRSEVDAIANSIEFE